MRGCTGARRFVLFLVTGFAAMAAFAVPAQAVDHLMEVNEIATSVGGDPNAQYIEILDPINEPFPSPTYRLVVYDANGVRLGAHDLGGDAQITDNNQPMLISTAAADAALGVTGHQALSVSLPVSAGQISFTRLGATEQKIHTLTYGCINQAVATSFINFGPKPTNTQSSQLQPSNAATLGAPTPKAANVAGTATASCIGEGHARPKAASPSSVKLTPAFAQCTSANGTHGAPLALPSCGPGAQTSGFLTLNAPDRAAPFNTAANGSGNVTFKVTCLSSVNPPVENGDSPPCTGNAGDQQDIKITSTLADVRCVGAGGQANCVGAAGSLYSGKVLLRTTIRITDRLHGGSLAPGTMNDTPLNIGFQCASGSCTTTTSVDSVFPNVAQEQRRAVWQLGQVEILDAGLDGALNAAPAPSTGVCPPSCVGNGGETVFMRQGLLAP
jgi:hypothetical protein